MKTIMIVIAALLLAGCVNYVKVEKTSAEGAKCHSIVRGNFFVFTTHAALEECRPDGDR